MSKASTLTKLPNEIQEALLNKLSEGHTIDDLVAYVSELGFDWVSRSSMGRYTKGLRPSVTKVLEARAVASAITEQLGDSTDDVGRATLELLQSVILKITEGLVAGGEISLTDIGGLSRAVGNLSKAKKDDIEAIRSARQEGAERAIEKAKAGIVTNKKKLGLSDEAIEKLQEFLG